MALFEMLREFINVPEFDLSPEKKCIFYQLMALKCFYLLEHLNISAIDQRLWTLFLALIVQIFLQAHLPLIVSAVCLPIILLSPFVWRGFGILPIYVILMMACRFYPVVPYILNFWTSFSCGMNIHLARDTDAFYQTFIYYMARLQMLGLLHAAFMYEWMLFFNLLMYFIGLDIFNRHRFGILEEVFVGTCVFLQIIWCYIAKWNHMIEI